MQLLIIKPSYFPKPKQIVSNCYANFFVLTAFSACHLYRPNLAKPV